MTVLRVVLADGSDARVLGAAAHLLSKYLDAKGALGAAKISRAPGMLEYLISTVFKHKDEVDVRQRYLHVLFQLRGNCPELSAKMMELWEGQERISVPHLFEDEEQQQEGEQCADGASQQVSVEGEPECRTSPRSSSRSPRTRSPRSPRSPRLRDLPHDVSLLGSMLRVDRFLRNRGGGHATENLLARANVQGDDLQGVALAMQRHPGYRDVAVAALMGILEKPTSDDFRIIADTPGFSTTLQTILDQHSGADVPTLVMELATGVLSTEADDAENMDWMPPEAREKYLDEQEAKLQGFSAACIAAMVRWLGEVPTWSTAVGHGSRRYHVFGDGAETAQELVEAGEEASKSWSPSHWSMWGAFICAVDALMETDTGSQSMIAAEFGRLLEEEWEKVIARRDEEVGKLMIRRFQEDTEAVIADLKAVAEEDDPGTDAEEEAQDDYDDEEDDSSPAG